MSLRYSAAALALLLCATAVQALEAGWGSGYQMGTSYAGVSDGQKSRLTFYCGDKAAARANSAIMGGSYLSIVLPKAPGLEAAKTVEIVVDGKAMQVPVVAKADLETVDLSWRPSRDFGIAKMKPVVAALRKAKAIEVKAAGVSAALPTQGAAKALAEDPLHCS